MRPARRAGRFADPEVPGHHREATRVSAPAATAAPALALHRSRSTLIRPSVNIQRQVLSLLERRVPAPDGLPLPTSFYGMSPTEHMAPDRRIRPSADRRHTAPIHGRRAVSIHRPMRHGSA